MCTHHALGLKLTSRASGHPARVLVLACLALGSIACAPPRFPKELFTIHGEGADYPVMVSRTQTAERTRPVHAESGTHFAQRSQSFSTGNATVTVTTTEAARSERSATEKLLFEVRRNDKFLLIDHVEFFADDFSTYGGSSADRTLSVQGKVGQ